MAWGGSNPGGGPTSRVRPDWVSEPPTTLHSGYRVFPVSKADGACCWVPNTLLAPRSRMGSICTFATPMRLHSHVMLWPLLLQVVIMNFTWHEVQNKDRHKFRKHWFIFSWNTGRLSANFSKDDDDDDDDYTIHHDHFSSCVCRCDSKEEFKLKFSENRILRKNIWIRGG